MVADDVILGGDRLPGRWAGPPAVDLPDRIERMDIVDRAVTITAHLDLGDGQTMSIPMDRTVADAVASMLEKMVLDDAGQARAAIAMVLARNLDSSRSTENGAVAQSIPAMAKELRATIQEILDSLAGDDPFLQQLLKDEDGGS